MPRSLILALTALFLAWLAAVAVLLCYLAALVAVPWLVGATVALIGAYPIIGAMVLVTNTRRPAGVDPDAAQQWGRRQEDKGIIETISEALEREAAKRPGPARTPEWAVGLGADDDHR